MPSRSSPVTAEATMVNAASDSTGFSLVATSAAPAAPRITAGASWGPAASPRNELVMAAMLLITTRPARAHPVPRHSSPSSSPENITAANEIVSETPITPTTNPARTWRGADRNNVLADAIGAPYRPAPRRLRHEIGLAGRSIRTSSRPIGSSPLDNRRSSAVVPTNEIAKMRP